MTKQATEGKQSMTIRLSAEARRLLEVMARRDGISRTAVIELAVRRFARQQGVEASDHGGAG